MSAGGHTIRVCPDLVRANLSERLKVECILTIKTDPSGTVPLRFRDLRVESALPAKTVASWHVRLETQEKKASVADMSGINARRVWTVRMKFHDDLLISQSGIDHSGHCGKELRREAKTNPGGNVKLLEDLEDNLIWQMQECRSC